MPYRKIIERPSVTLFRQRSPVTCWVASAYMLFNWKNGTTTSYDQFVMGNLPLGIYGFYLLEEKLVQPDGSRDASVFNSAFFDLDSKWNNIFRTDSATAREARLAEGEHDYANDFNNGKISQNIIDVLNSTTGTGLPYSMAAEFLTFSGNDFKSLGENKLYSPKEWFAMLYHYGPLLVSVCRTEAATGKRFGHFIIVDGFWGSEPFDASASCQVYAQDPMFGTIRGQLFPQFQDDCKDALAKVGTFKYIWHANKTGIRNLTIEQCVQKLERDLPKLKVK